MDDFVDPTGKSLFSNLVTNGHGYNADESFRRYAPERLDRRVHCAVRLCL